MADHAAVAAEPPGPTRPNRYWWWSLAVGSIGVVSYAIAPGLAIKSVDYLLVAATSVIALLYGVVRNEPELRAPWFWMAGGLTLWVVADAIYSYLELVLGQSPFPSVSDAFYVAGYLALAWGIHLLVRGRHPQRDIGGIVDALILTAGLALLSWVLLLNPILLQSETPTVDSVVAAVYPIGDILLAGGLIRLISSARHRSISLALLFLALASLIAADTAFSALELFDVEASAPLDYAFLAAYWLWAAAAVHPSMRRLSQPEPTERESLGIRRLIALVAASLIAPGILAAELLSGGSLDLWGVIVGSIVLFLLVVLRMKVAIDRMLAIDAERTTLQKEVVHQATHDQLTGLPNRAEARRRVAAALDARQHTGGQVAVLFVDLDGFKLVNDHHGHPAGDDVLRTMGQRIARSVRVGDTTARLGGDEFLVLLPTVATLDDAVAVGERLVNAVAAPVRLPNGREVVIGASAGIAMTEPASTPGVDVLLQEADTAVYQAKARGRGRVVVHSGELREHLSARAALEDDLRAAIANDTLDVHYQPIVNATTLEVVAYEALARWDRPGFGPTPPDAFIPVAESSSLICDLDCWVMDRAAAQLEEWNDQGSRRTVSVNISGAHLNRPRVVDDVARALATHRIDAGQLVIEVTETVLIETAVGAQHLGALKELGVAAALDDFGSGYASISLLARLPLDFLKVDKGLISHPHPATITLLRLTVATAHAFGMRVVVEGIEHPDHLEIVRDAGAELVQGYLLAPPGPVSELRTGRLGPVHPSRPPMSSDAPH